MLRAFLLCLIAALFSGCAGYQLGPSNGDAAGSRSVLVTPFENKTLEPRLSDAVNIALRRSLQRDGTFQLVSSGRGDITLSGALVNYHRHEVSFQPDDVQTARDYRIALTAEVVAKDKNGKVIMNQQVSGYTLVRYTTDLASAEREAIPLAAEDLAQRITGLLADGNW